MVNVIRYRADAWQIDPQRWHGAEGSLPRRILAVHDQRTRSECEAIVARLPWRDDIEVAEVDADTLTAADWARRGLPRLPYMP